jgi:hypothetical protein
VVVCTASFAAPPGRTASYRYRSTQTTRGRPEQLVRSQGLFTAEKRRGANRPLTTNRYPSINPSARASSVQRMRWRYDGGFRLASAARPVPFFGAFHDSPAWCLSEVCRLAWVEAVTGAVAGCIACIGYARWNRAGESYRSSSI